jgi:hypothetical protein
MFIKIGDRVVNMNRVGHASLNDGGRVILTVDGRDRLEFAGREADLLREHFTEDWFGMRAIDEGAEPASFIDLDAEGVKSYRR